MSSLPNTPATLRDLMGSLRWSSATQAPAVLVELASSTDEEESQTIEVSSADAATELDVSAAYADRPCLVLAAAAAAEGELKLALGRDGASDVIIRGGSVSKHHASIEIDQSGKFFVADAGSRNGTFVNGARLKPGKRSRLTPGARVGFGDRVFVFLDPTMVRELTALLR